MPIEAAQLHSDQACCGGEIPAFGGNYGSSGLESLNPVVESRGLRIEPL